MGFRTCRWCGRTFDGTMADPTNPTCSDRCKQEQQASSRQQWNENASAIGNVINSFVAQAEAARQQEEAAQYEAMVAEQNRLLAEQQQAAQQRLHELAVRENQLKNLLAEMAHTLKHEADSVGLLSAIDLLQQQIANHNYKSEDLQHVADRQAFREIVTQSHERLTRIDEKTQANFQRFKTLYARYGEQFFGRSEFAKPPTEDFTEKPLVTAFDVPKPAVRHFDPDKLNELVPPSEELLQSRKSKTVFAWLIGAAVLSNLCLPVLGAIIAVLIYVFGMKRTNKTLLALEEEHQHQIEKLKSVKTAELKETHRKEVARWMKEKKKFEASIPALNSQIEEHNASVRQRCEEAQAKWEQEREKFISTINKYIAQHPTITDRFPRIGDTREERDENLRAVFGVKNRAR